MERVGTLIYQEAMSQEKHLGVNDAGGWRCERSSSIAVMFLVFISILPRETYLGDGCMGTGISNAPFPRTLLSEQFHQSGQVYLDKARGANAYAGGGHDRERSEASNAKRFREIPADHQVRLQDRTVANLPRA